MLVPILAVSLLTNQEIFNAYLVWADEQFQLTFFGQTLPTSWMITIDAAFSFSMLVGVAAFWKWYGVSGLSAKWREPDELPVGPARQGNREAGRAVSALCARSLRGRRTD